MRVRVRCHQYNQYNQSYPPNQPGDLNITVGPNQNATGSSFAVDVDRDGMVLSIEGDAVVDSTACQLHGPGSDRDFTGAKRSASKCVPGPLGSLAVADGRIVAVTMFYY